jgi:hypothetical protein
MEDSFWTHDTLLFAGTFHYYHDKQREVRGKLHLSEEEYKFHEFGHSLQHFRPRRHRFAASEYREEMRKRYQMWGEITGAEMPA